MATITIDWVSASFSGNRALQFRDIVGADGESKGGRLGYTHCSKGARGFVAWGGENGNSHMQVQGGNHAQALALLEVGEKFTRVDIALDIRDPKLISLVKHHLRTRKYSGASRNIKEISTNGSLETIYLGSRTSEKYIRFYDKAKEQKTGGNWWRFEIEIKGLLADAICKLIKQGACLASIIAGCIQFRENANRFSNLASFWKSLTSDPVRAQVKRNERGNLTSRIEWLKRQYGKTIQELRQREGLARTLREIHNATTSNYQSNMRIPRTCPVYRGGRKGGQITQARVYA